MVQGDDFSLTCKALLHPLLHHGHTKNMHKCTTDSRPFLDLICELHNYDMTGQGRAGQGRAMKALQGRATAGQGHNSRLTCNGVQQLLSSVNILCCKVLPGQQGTDVIDEPVCPL